MKIWFTEKSGNEIIASEYIVLTRFGDRTFRLSSGSQSDVELLQQAAQRGGYNIDKVYVWKRDQT